MNALSNIKKFFVFFCMNGILCVQHLSATVDADFELEKTQEFAAEFTQELAKLKKEPSCAQGTNEPEPSSKKKK